LAIRPRAARDSFLSSSDWYQGTADAVRQNIRYVHEDGCRDVLIHSGDQIYRMDFGQLLQTHRVSALAVLDLVPVDDADVGADAAVLVEGAIVPDCTVI